jgi:hypothetical protein
MSESPRIPGFQRAGVIGWLMVPGASINNKLPALVITGAQDRPVDLFQFTPDNREISEQDLVEKTARLGGGQSRLGFRYGSRNA